jgi:hypothetical protein
MLHSSYLLDFGGVDRIGLGSAVRALYGVLHRAVISVSKGRCNLAIGQIAANAHHQRCGLPGLPEFW